MILDKDNPRGINAFKRFLKDEMSAINIPRHGTSEYYDLRDKIMLEKYGIKFVHADANHIHGITSIEVPDELMTFILMKYEQA